MAGLRAAQRLRRRSEFQRAYREGRLWSGQLVQIFTIDNELGLLRVGITVTRKSGSAVRRNRLRRQIREGMSILLEQIEPASRDLVIHVRPGVREAAYGDLFSELESLVARSLAAPARRRRRS